tara:strand:+ start:659 stop:1384 length:726 start_codon:yes stop_codon:yes gene_type:complete
LINFIRSVFLYFNGVISVIVIGIAVIIIGIFDKKKNITGNFIKFWGKWVCFSSGIETEVEGLNKISYNKQYIFVSNHESMLDIPVSLSLLPYNIIFLTKKELFNIPLFGLAMHSVGMIKVDRKNREKAKISVKEALMSLNKKNISVLVYPEGTRSKPNELLKFKKGSFILAIQSGLPIVPITIINTGLNLPTKSLILKDKQKIKLKIHKPILTENLNIELDKNNLCESTYKIILNDIKTLT